MILLCDENLPRMISIPSNVPFECYFTTPSTLDVVMPSVSNRAYTITLSTALTHKDYRSRFMRRLCFRLENPLYKMIDIDLLVKYAMVESDKELVDEENQRFYLLDYDGG